MGSEPTAELKVEFRGAHRETGRWVVRATDVCMLMGGGGGDI